MFIHMPFLSFLTLNNDKKIVYFCMKLSHHLNMRAKQLHYYDKSFRCFHLKK